MKLTSLGGRTLRDKFPDNPYFRHHHIPIYPCEAHPDSGMQLFLDDSLQLRRDTFVKTESRYELSLRVLTPYDDTGRQFKLHPVAFRELMAFLHTPYSKPDDVELELFAEPEKSFERMDSDGYASIAENHIDLDKVNSLQAQIFGESLAQGMTNTTTGFCGGDTLWTVGMVWISASESSSGCCSYYFYLILSQLLLFSGYIFSLLKDIKGYQGVSKNTYPLSPHFLHLIAH